MRRTALIVIALAFLVYPALHADARNSNTLTITGRVLARAAIPWPASASISRWFTSR
jgi:hypothetical protein